MKMREKVTWVRVIGGTIELIILVGGIWSCINYIPRNGISWFGLSPDQTGLLGAGVFLILILWVFSKIGDKFVYWWIKVEKENKDGSFPTKEE